MPAERAGTRSKGTFWRQRKFECTSSPKNSGLTSKELLGTRPKTRHRRLESLGVDRRRAGGPHSPTRRRGRTTSRGQPADAAKAAKAAKATKATKAASAAKAAAAPSDAPRPAPRRARRASPSRPPAATQPSRGRTHAPRSPKRRRAPRTRRRGARAPRSCARASFRPSPRPRAPSRPTDPTPFVRRTAPSVAKAARADRLVPPAHECERSSHPAAAWSPHESRPAAPFLRRPACVARCPVPLVAGRGPRVVRVP